MSETTVPQYDWRAASPAYIAIQFARNVRGLIVPAIVILASRGLSGANGQQAVFIWIGLAIAVVVALASLYSWRLFRYRVTDRQLTVKSGLINRQERSLAFERIQAVNVEEAPLDRIFGVVKVRVETAGGGGEADIEVEALTRHDAEALRTHLLRARQAARGLERGTVTLEAATGEPTAPTSGEGQLVRQLSTADLLLAGVTSGRIGPALALVGFATQFADDVLPQSFWEQLPYDDIGDLASDLSTLAFLVLGVGLFAWLLSIASTVLAVGGFEIRREDDQLLIRYGLLDRRRLTIPMRRVQAVRVVEGMLRQPFGLAEVRFESAGHLSESGEKGVLFPLLPRREIAAFLAEVAPDFAIDPTRLHLHPLPERAFPRYVIPSTLIIFLMALGGTSVIRWVTGAWQQWSYLLLLPVVLVAIYSVFEYRDAGWAVRNGRLIVRRRNLGRELLVTRVQRLQHRRLAANWMQRRAGLATFRAAVASSGGVGSFEVVHLDREDGERMLAALAPRRR